MDKRFLGVLAVIAIVLGSLFFFTSDNKAGAPSAGNASVSNHVKGDGASGVKLVEYGDFECPACNQYYPIVKQVYEKYKADITVQFRHFPLMQIHPNALAGSRAAEAASKQGKFWEMHDLLYENQQSWSPSRDPQTAFVAYAKQLGLDTNKFTTDFRSSETNSIIQADSREGTRLNVDSTPTFFIDGKKISNPTSLEAFNKVIETAIEQKTGKKPAAAAETAPPAAPAESPDTNQ